MLGVREGTGLNISKACNITAFPTPTLYFGEGTQLTPNSGSGHLGALETYIHMYICMCVCVYIYNDLKIDLHSYFINIDIKIFAILHLLLS